MFYRPHPRHATPTGTISMTKQSHKAECDIHNILSQYKKTGILNHINNNQPLYQELPSDIDYQTSLNTIMEANATFQSLPARVRDHYGNDPAAFLAAFNDPREAERLRDWGLLKPLQKAAEAPPPSPPAT